MGGGDGGGSIGGSSWVCCHCARRISVVVAIFCLLSDAGSGLAVDVPLQRKVVEGGLEVLVAALQVGTPPQRIWVQIDTASQGTFLPGAGPSGFKMNASSTAVVADTASVPFHGGLQVIGKSLQDNVMLSDASVLQAPLLIGQNYSGRKPPRGIGVMGLVCLLDSQGLSRGVPGITEEYHPGKRTGSFLEEFWRSNPKLRKQYLLELGGRSPRLVIGDTSTEGPREQGGVRFLGHYFTSPSSMWYVSLRAFGLSQDKASPVLLWSHDFNAALAPGTPALLDSGTRGIHVGSIIYAALISKLPRGCQWDPVAQTTRCPCSESTYKVDFPSFSFSFEAADTIRFLGLDSGEDVRVCMDAASYVHYDNVSKRCIVAIVDSGPRRVLYGYETVILGEPFFRSAAVVLDLQRRRVGIGASPGGTPFGPVVEAAQREGQWDSAGGAGTESDPCPCADPKNWWSTGRRFSLRRVVVCLVFVGLVAAYTFFGYSPSPVAQQGRQLIDTMCPGVSDWAAGDDHLFNQQMHGYPSGSSAPGGGVGRSRPPGSPWLQMATQGGGPE